jgi:hypothetical protein
MLLLILVLIGVALVGAVTFLDRREPRREPILPAIRRTLAGEDRLTPRARRRNAVIAAASTLISAGSWTLVALGVGPIVLTRELGILALVAAAASASWLVISWLGARKGTKS